MKVWKCCQTWQKTIWDRELIFFFTAQGENAGIALRELGRGAGFPPARELALAPRRDPHRQPPQLLLQDQVRHRPWAVFYFDEKR